MSGCKIGPCALGMSLGVLWGVSLVVMGLISHHFEYGRAFVSSVGTLYLGYETSIRGIIIGGVIGFVDAFIMGFLIAWLYNRFSCGQCCCTKKGE